MSIETGNEGAQHPFFHTMVVMGSALALGCGGMSNADELERTPSGGSGGGGSGGGGSGGGGSGGGGSGGFGGFAGTGGSTGSTGGAGIIVLQGGSAGQTPVEPGPFKCSPAQWGCSTYVSCSGDGFELPENCTCDTSRPEGPDDCPSGQTFACRNAVATADGRPFTRAVPFQCSCVPMESTCDAACDHVFPDTATCDQVDSSGRSVLCGCAVIVLR
jgi:hypothetical protein